jgi:Flp pilus assembly protein TadD
MRTQLLENTSDASPPACAQRFQRALRYQANNQKLEAAREYLQALEIRPTFFEAAFNLGVLFQQMGQNSDAIGCYRHALQCRPDLATAWGNLGVALRDTGHEEDALESFRRSLTLCPNEPQVLNNLGNTLLARNRYEEAIERFSAAARLAPSDAGIRLNLGNALRAAGRLPEAIATLRAGVELSPGSAEAHWDLAFALLLRGDLAEGLREYDWRIQRKDYPQRQFPSPLWQGEELSGRTLLVHSEQGAGDAIQFVRFVTPLWERGARVMLECPASLARLFRSVAGVRQVIPRGEALPRHDWHVPMLSLPRQLGIDERSLPSAAPYLEPAWRGARTGAAGAKPLRVGLAWRGNPKHPNDRHRSISLPTLSPIFHVRGVSFHNLQAPPAPEFADEAAGVGAFQSVADLSSDFHGTAELISSLDLVISVDTSVAHLGGALGCPVWLLLPFAPDWRWLLRREDTPWYPSVRLFRQASAGDWDPVVRAVCEALRARAVAAAP